jgi:hypothetical protein
MEVRGVSFPGGWPNGACDGISSKKRDNQKRLGNWREVMELNQRFPLPYLLPASGLILLHWENEMISSSQVSIFASLLAADGISITSLNGGASTFILFAS